MANSKITIEAILQDHFSNTLKEMSGGVDSLSTKLSGLAMGALSVAGGMSLFSVAEKGFSAVKDEIMDSEKASIDYEKSIVMMKFSMRDFGVEGQNAMTRLAESSKLFKSTDMMDAERKLHDIGQLNEQQIEKILPLIQEYATATGKELPEAIDRIAPAFETGRIRGQEFKSLLEGTGGVLKEGDIQHNVDAISKSLGKFSGAIKTLETTEAGALQEHEIYRNKLRELGGESLLTQVGDIFKTGWVEYWHQSSIAALLAGEESDRINKEMKDEKDKYSHDLNNKILLEGKYQSLLHQEVYIKDKLWNLTKTGGFSVAAEEKLRSTLKGIISDETTIKNILKDWAPAIDEANTSLDNFSTGFSDLNKNLSKEETDLENSIYYDLTHNKMTPQEIINNLNRGFVNPQLKTDLQTKQQIELIKNLFEGKKEGKLETDTGENLRKSANIKSIEITINKMVGIETVETTMLDSNTINKVGEEVLVVLERAAHDAQNIAMTR